MRFDATEWRLNDDQGNATAISVRLLRDFMGDDYAYHIVVMEAGRAVTRAIYPTLDTAKIGAMAEWREYHK